MKSYLYETHCHTSPASACASWSGAQAAEYYKALNYDGIIVTDHFFNGNTGIDRSLPWSEKIELFCAGYEQAYGRGREIGLDVFMGLEYNRAGAEFLIYGLDKAALLEHPEIMELRIPELYRTVSELGGAMVQAHPFRRAGYLERICLYPDYCDGAEAVNTANRREHNENAIWYAKRFDLYMTCGSDAHWSGRDDLGGVLLEGRLNSASDYADVIKYREPIRLFTQKDYGFWETVSERK